MTSSTEAWRIWLGILTAVALVTAGDRGPAQAPVREGFLTSADGTRLFYQVVGAGPDTLVAIHGGPGAGINNVRPDLEPLTDRHVIIFYDQRGGGRSELPEDTTRLTAQAFVEDLEAVRQHFGLSYLNLVAHSFGAVIVGEYAAVHPQRIARVALHAATGPSRVQAARFYSQPNPGLDSALVKRQSDILRSLMQGTASDPVATCREYEELSRQAAQALGRAYEQRGTMCDMSAEAIRYSLRYTARLVPRDVGDWDYTTLFEDLETPFLVIDGRPDTNALAMSRAWAAAVPNGRLITGAGFGRNPEGATETLDQFFSGGWPDRSKKPE